MQPTFWDWSRYETLEALKENLSQDKTRSLEILQANHKQDMDNFVSNFESIAEVEIV